MKRVTIFFYGEGESGLAQELAKQERVAQQVGYSRDATVFSGEIEDCNRIVILDNVPAHKRTHIEAAYAGLIDKSRGSDGWQGGTIEGGPIQEAVGVPLEAKVESAVIHGPKANPEQVSRDVAEINLKPKFDTPPARPSRPPSRPPRRAKETPSV